MELLDHPVLAWRCRQPWLSVSSGPHGGGIGHRRWVLNATVEPGYDREDPDHHVSELAGLLGLPGQGTGLLTAVDVRHVVTVVDEDVQVSVTTGVGRPVWAADRAEAEESYVPGTINVVCWLPWRLSESTLVRGVTVVAEAKAAALMGAGIAGTGTCTDAMVLSCRPDGPAPPDFGRLWTEALAWAVRRAVAAGLRVPDPTKWPM
ncbi:adenosylcobinamide amidohydrolase [Micromonospora okii]|uniref:adenosylcobinamide amidohydrolase n=1 Tax=Micromonospora okii TaxID=1182970 RepID=UPI001E28677A|nr:adenosylcobinamide amidohydrolase [Micromonospora okii]